MTTNNPNPFGGLEPEDLLRQKITQTKKRLAELERALAALSGTGASRPLPALVDGNLPPVQPDQYKGQRLGDALESYLRARQGHHIPQAKAAEDLFAGGFDFKARSATPAKRLQGLRIGLWPLQHIAAQDEDGNLYLAPDAINKIHKSAWQKEQKAAATEAPKQRWKKKH